MAYLDDANTFVAMGHTITVSHKPGARTLMKQRDLSAANPITANRYSLEVLGDVWNAKCTAKLHKLVVAHCCND